MKLPKFTPVDAALAALCLGVLLANGWQAALMTQQALLVDGLQASVDEQSQNVRRLRNIDNVSAAQQEVTRLQSQLAAGVPTKVPGTFDQPQLIYGLLDFLPESAARLVGFRSQEAKSQTIETEVFRLLGYEITMEGDPFDMLKMVQRVDENKLASLTIPALSLTRDELGWSMKAAVVARIHSGSLPKPTPTPTPKPAPPPTPTPAK